MNLDISSTFNFGDQNALRQFFLDHRFVHDSESRALTTKYGGSWSTTGLDSSLAEQGWGDLMRNREGPSPQVLVDWLELHATIHNQTYQRIAGVGTVAPDLSVAEFWRPTSFYDWMYVHQQMHDYEQSVLGVS